MLRVLNIKGDEAIHPSLINFKKIRNKEPKLKQLIKDYRFKSFGNNYYQMLFSFYKYVLETIEDYF